MYASSPSPPPLQLGSGELHVVAAAILRDGSCFAARRAPGERLAGKWELPGGKVEPGEPPGIALRREIREELQVEIEVGPWLARSRHADDNLQLVLDVFRARIVKGNIGLTVHDRYGWFGPEALESLEWAAADRVLIPDLKNLLTASHC